MNVPFTAVHFATYESAKTAMASWAGWEHEEETLLVQLLAGQCIMTSCGTLACAVLVLWWYFQISQVSVLSKLRHAEMLVTNAHIKLSLASQFAQTTSGPTG